MKGIVALSLLSSCADSSVSLPASSCGARYILEYYKEHEGSLQRIQKRLTRGSLHLSGHCANHHTEARNIDTDVDGESFLLGQEDVGCQETAERIKRHGERESLQLEAGAAGCHATMRLRGGKTQRAKGSAKRKGGYVRKKEKMLRRLRHERSKAASKEEIAGLDTDGQEFQVCLMWPHLSLPSSASLRVPCQGECVVLVDSGLGVRGCCTCTPPFSR